jgi:hypothetical protein
VIFIAKDIESSSPTPSSMPVRWQIISCLLINRPRSAARCQPRWRKFLWILPFEERARDLGRQTSTASTGRRGLAWADSLG